METHVTGATDVITAGITTDVTAVITAAISAVIAADIRRRVLILGCVQRCPWSAAAFTSMSE